MDQRIQLWDKKEYKFPGAGAFIPFLQARIHEDEETHPAMIVAPGGGFILLQPAEADGIAGKFFDLGYNTFVLVYTNNTTLDHPGGRQAVKDAARAVRMIRKNAGAYRIDPARIAVFGSSGGGYMAAALATLHDQPEMAEEGTYGDISARPDAVILNYALTTGGEFSCLGAYDMLLGKDASDEERKAFSLETRVHETTAPIISIHGMNDMMVPVENAMMMGDACRKYGVPYEAHLFSGCNHGFTVAELPPEDTVSSFYVFDQLYETIRAMSPEEFAGYADLLGDLRQDMSYEEFAPEALEKTMMKLWGAGLKDQMEYAIGQAPAVMEKVPYLMKTHPSTAYIMNLADNWLKLIWD